MIKKKYTLITGASEGLGKAMAFECARSQMHLILVSLPGTRLADLANFIKKNFFVEVSLFEKDLSDPIQCRELYEEIKQAGLAVNMLINNAGVGGTGYFMEADINLLETQIKVNVLATTLLSRLFIHDLRENKPSYLLNVSSLGCFFHLPKKQVYGGTKSFIYFFSKCLQSELRTDGVSVTVVCPGGMNSNPSLALLNRTGTWLSRMSVLNPEEVAPIAIRGLLNRDKVIVPGSLNRFFLMLDKICPVTLKVYLLRYQMNLLRVKNPAWRPSPVSLHNRPVVSYPFRAD